MEEIDLFVEQVFPEPAAYEEVVRVMVDDPRNLEALTKVRDSIIEGDVSVLSEEQTQRAEEFLEQCEVMLQDIGSRSMQRDRHADRGVTNVGSQALPESPPVTRVIPDAEWEQIIRGTTEAMGVPASGPTQVQSSSRAVGRASWDSEWGAASVTTSTPPPHMSQEEMLAALRDAAPRLKEKKIVSISKTEPKKEEATVSFLKARVSGFKSFWLGLSAYLGRTNRNVVNITEIPGTNFRAKAAVLMANCFKPVKVRMIRYRANVIDSESGEWIELNGDFDLQALPLGIDFIDCMNNRTGDMALDLSAACVWLLLNKEDLPRDKNLHPVVFARLNEMEITTTGMKTQASERRIEI